MNGADQPRVLVFVPGLEPGGAQRVLMQVADGLASRGISILMVVGRAVGQIRASVPEDLEVLQMGRKRTVSAVPQLAMCIRRLRPDAVLTGLDQGNVAVVVASRLARWRGRLILSQHHPPGLVTSHDRTLRGRLMGMSMRWCYPRADSVVAVSEGVAEDLRRFVRGGETDIETIYNPIDYDAISKLAREDDGEAIFGNEPFVVAAGRLTPEKDYPTLLRAMRVIRERAVARLVILGDGPQRSELIRLASDLEISRSVRFRGHVANPYPFIRRADVLALSSRWEGFALVLAEAMALGTNVVSTDCLSGPREVLGPDRSDALVPVGDHRALAAKILEKLDEPAPDPYRDPRFEIDTVVSQYADVLGLDRA